MTTCVSIHMWVLSKYTWHHQLMHVSRLLGIIPSHLALNKLRPLLHPTQIITKEGGKLLKAIKSFQLLIGQMIFG